MIIIVMGVTGSGKTTVAKLLSKRCGFKFYEGDSLHPSENVRKMAAGTPLADEDRRPWLQKIRDLISADTTQNTSAVVSCSALKNSYREMLALPGTRFVYLKISRDLARARLLGRPDHFMPASLVDSQFAALEEPADALTLDASLPPAELVTRIAAAFSLPEQGSH